MIKRNGTLKVIQINRWDISGGAAIAAYRQHHALRAVGIDSTMYVEKKFSEDDTVLELDLSNPTAANIAFNNRVRMQMQMLNSKHSGKIHSHLGPFSPPYAFNGRRMASQLPEADILNLHWICGFVDYLEFFSHEKAAVPMVWTLHDMYPFTGGCHYAGDCEKFTGACGACGYISSEDDNDISRNIHQIKARALAAARHPIQVVTPSKWLAGEARRSRLFGQMDVRVIPYSLNLNDFKPRPQDEMRELLDLPKDKVIGFFPSDNVDDPRKGLVYLEQALRLLRPEEASRMILVTVGRSGYRLEGPVEQRSLPFASEPDVMSAIYNTADFTFLPSLEDNLPNVILESMASGRPLIAFDTGGASDFIIDGETGWITPKCDVEALARATQHALASPDELMRMRDTVRAVAEREFAPQVQGARYKALYEEVLECHRARAGT